MASRRPRIGINLDFEPGPPPRSYLRHGYYDAIWSAGGHPVLLPPLDDEYLDEALAGVDALVLTGGDDLDPALYGSACHPSCTLTPARRQEFDLRLTRRALEGHFPILGICAGLQTLNVVLGGDLIQDIPTCVEGAVCHHTHDPLKPAEHEVRVEPGSALATQCRLASFVSNSAHHQSAGRLGRGLRAVAFAPDGIIEAIEHVEAPIVAVQWHPERIAAREPHGRLFEELVAAARRRRP